MGAFRDGVFRQLIAADTHRRLRIVYPAAARAQNVPTFVHSKVMIVDDELVRIGSANFSRRSMGVDTECDLAVDAGGDSRVRAGIRRIRDRLLAEHLALPVEASPASSSARDPCARSSIRGSCADHTLVRVELEAAERTPPPEALRAAADPDEPIGFGSSVTQLVPPVDARARRNPLRLWIPLIVLTVALASTSSAFIRRPEFQAIQRRSWRRFDHAVEALDRSQRVSPGEPRADPAGSGGDRRWGDVRRRSRQPRRPGRIADGGDHRLRWSAARLGRPADPLDEPAIVSLRPATRRARRRRCDRPAARVGCQRGIRSSVLRCGARPVRDVHGWHGALGSTPVVAALSGLGGLLRQTLLHPSVSNGAITIGAALLLIAAAAGLRTFLLIRQFAPSVSLHRDRAEFG